MNQLFKLLILSVTVLFLFSGGAWALTFSELGTDITIDDNRDRSGDWSGDSDSRGVKEDKEVEPGMVATQYWDLEAFTLNGNILSMVGGWDFTGISPEGYTSGDIFIDINGDAKYGVDAEGFSGNMNYDYVIDINWITGQNSGNYDVYSIKNLLDDQFQDTTYNSPQSDPWKFIKKDDQSIFSGSFSAGKLTDKPFDGDDHYYATGFDLSFLTSDPYFSGVFTSHFTMQCGNDNLMGSGTAPVPEPATMLLLGIGLIGIAGISRKKLVKK